MDIEAAFKFIIFLLLFGITNYGIMLWRYERDIKRKKLIQKIKISNLYPKDTPLSC